MKYLIVFALLLGLQSPGFCPHIPPVDDTPKSRQMSGVMGELGDNSYMITRGLKGSVRVTLPPAHAKTWASNWRATMMDKSLSNRYFQAGDTFDKLVLGDPEGAKLVCKYETSHGYFMVYDNGSFTVTNYKNPEIEPFGSDVKANKSFVNHKTFIRHLQACGIQINDFERARE